MQFDTALINTNIVEKIREVKDEGEIQTIREACRISDAAFHILDFIKPGVTALGSKWIRLLYAWTRSKRGLLDTIIEVVFVLQLKRGARKRTKTRCA